MTSRSTRSCFRSENCTPMLRANRRSSGVRPTGPRHGTSFSRPASCPTTRATARRRSQKPLSSVSGSTSPQRRRSCSPTGPRFRARFPGRASRTSSTRARRKRKNSLRPASRPASSLSAIHDGGPVAILDFISKQFIDIIEWTDDSRDTLSYRFPDEDKEIKRGAQLIVRESQVAQFVYLGQFGDTFGPGNYTLTTDNIPVLSDLKRWKYGFESPFKADVYYVVTRLFTGNKWGTANP